MTSERALAPLVLAADSITLSDGRPANAVKLDEFGLRVGNQAPLAWDAIERLSLTLAPFRVVPRLSIPAFTVIAALSGIANSTDVIPATADVLEVYRLQNGRPAPTMDIYRFRVRSRLTKRQRCAIVFLVNELTKAKSREALFADPARAFADAMNSESCRSAS